MKTGTPLFNLMMTVSIIIFISAVSCNSNKQQKTETALADTLERKDGCCTPEILDTTWYSSGKKAPLFSGLDGIDFPVSTKNAEVQKYFNQGLMLSYGFNHAEAGRSFFEAARQDSACAMCWWGYAYILGPNYNGGMEKDNFERAFNAVKKAKALSVNCTAKEKELIEALTFRYTNDTSVTRPVLDSAYSAVMGKVYLKYKDDDDVAALFAESLMDLHPWNLWQKDGTIQPWTPEILEVLERCMKLNPKHPGANHFYIHAMEMSQQAEKSLPSAQLLHDLVPGSGHLVHMPSHTYIRIGRYHDGVVANEKAVLVDSLYTVACHAQGVYPLAYYPHNYHFISACATLSGESKTAMIGADKTRQHAHKKLLRDPAWATLQHYYSIPWYVEVKLGLWDRITNSPAPDEDIKYPMAIWHYAKGMASLAKNNIADSRKHLDGIKDILKDTTIKALTIWGINSVYDLCIIAEKVLEGEICTKEKKYNRAIILLKEAVSAEDTLNYDEPPDWFFSVRHHLGAVLIESGKYNEAIQVYKEDLKIYRDNGWALCGMMNAYKKTGNKSKYDETKKLFDESWKYADIKIKGSRIL